MRAVISKSIRGLSAALAFCASVAIWPGVSTLLAYAAQHVLLELTREAPKQFLHPPTPPGWLLFLISVLLTFPGWTTLLVELADLEIMPSNVRAFQCNLTGTKPWLPAFSLPEISWLKRLCLLALTFALSPIQMLAFGSVLLFSFVPGILGAWVSESILKLEFHLGTVASNSLTTLFILMSFVFYVSVFQPLIEMCWAAQAFNLCRFYSQRLEAVNT